MSWLLGRVQVSYYAASKSIQLSLKSKKSDGTPDEPGSLSLLEFVKSITPSCSLSPLLPGGHAQTIYTVICGKDVPIYYKRKIFESSQLTYSGSFAVDFISKPFPSSEEDGGLPPRTAYFSEDDWKSIDRGSKDGKPMLVVLHGLSGGSHELYLREVLAPLVGVGGNAETAATDETWEVCVVNARGCAKSKITSDVLFNARATWDVRQFVEWLSERYPNRPLYGLGFSLGGNILVNYIAEEGDNCKLKAGVVCSNPFDLAAGSLGLQRTWMGREVYSKAMGGNMKRLLKSHEEQVSKNPRVNLDRVFSTTYLHEFDRELQGPTWGYPTEGAYYRDASSTEPLMAVRIPLLAINAEDDPVVCKDALPFQEVQTNPYTVLCTTSMGGHLGWFEPGGGRWFVKPAVGFLRKFHREVDLGEVDKRNHGNMNGAPTGGHPGNIPKYDPMLRKLQIQLR
ncbi:MAG: hypothetical protein M1831_004635 [Alyxoria varia]|nr:MAG: hypothetical protein M1831_004635 [Alyxoria varia]